MARLIVKSAGFEERVIELKLGVNHFGRHPGNDFPIEHPTISSRHCEIELLDGQLLVRDCGSTNGTCVDGQRIKEAVARAGQTIRLGDVLLLVDNAEISVAIPKFQMPDERPKPPVVLSDGGMVCPKHPFARASYQCTHCLEVMCGECAHRLRRRGGKTHHLCPKCSYPCTPLSGPEPKKESLFSRVTRTVKLPFVRRSKGK
jgi:hypothetical protein